jgi:hypothetical protein
MNILNKTACTVCAAALLASANIPASAETITLGDLTGEGNPTVSSIVKIASHLIGKEEFGNYERSAADVDRSGEVNIKDLMLEVLYVGGKLDKFPRPEPKMIDNPKVIDEFIPSTATMEDNFEDDVVLVTIMHQYSVMNRAWTATDFGVDNVNYIRDLTYSDWTEEEKQEYFATRAVFRQILAINLLTPGKEKVLQMIKDIESKEILGLRRVIVSHYNEVTDIRPNQPGAYVD